MHLYSTSFLNRYMVTNKYAYVLLSYCCSKILSTNLVAQRNTDIFSQNSGSKKFKISFAGTKSWCQQGPLTLKVLRENLFPFFFSFQSCVMHISWLVVPSSISKASSLASSNVSISIMFPLCHNFFHLLLFLKRTLVQHWAHSDNLG